MIHVRWILAALAATASLACADTLTLRDGRTVEGQYLCGNSRQIRMAVGEEIRSFNVSDVAEIRFVGGVPTAAVAAPAPAAEPAPAAAPAPAPERTVMTPAAPAAAPAARGDEIPAGTEVVVRMIDDVDSKVNNVGQTFRASVDEPVMIGGRVAIPRGADAVVKLTEMKDPSKLGGGGQLTLDLDSILVNGKPLEVGSQSVTIQGESRKKQSAAVIGGTAALGAIIGAIAGGGKGAAIGGVSGAGAGTAVQVLTQGVRVRAPAETRLTFALQQPVRIP